MPPLRMVSIPDELLNHICDLLKRPELCALRIVSKVFEAFASVHLKAKVYPLVKRSF